MVDRTTKTLLFAIALGLWMNVASQWLVPVALAAQDVDVSKIEHDLHGLYSGLCLNSKLC